MLTFRNTDWTCTWTGDARRVDLHPAGEILHVELAGPPTLTGKGAVIAAPAAGWRLDSDSILRLKASASGGDLQVAVAARTDQYYESPVQTVTTGGAQVLAFDLAANNFKSGRSSWQHSDRINHAEPLQNFELVLYPVANEKRTLNLASVALAGAVPPPTRPARTPVPLTIGSITAPDRTARYGRFEVAALISAAAPNPFDPDQMQVDAVFTAPSGRTLTCPAFVFKLASNGNADEWHARFSPDEEGRWTWKLTARTADASIESKPSAFTCTGVASRGTVSVAESDSRYFEFADGTFFYPIGHNVCWNTIEEYREQFALMGRAGENWSRIWIAPWNCDIEWSPKAGPYEGLGWYNLKHAAKLDEIVELAEQNGLYLQLVLHEHCRLSAKTNPEWQNNPYSKDNGGPCAAPVDFFTDPDAIRMAKNRIRYLVARYGYSSHVLAWELFNEVDLTDDFELKRDASWHREMSEYIEALDPHGHMVMTSYISTPNEETYAMDSIAFTQSHIYDADVVSFFNRLAKPYTKFGKPHFVGEFGSHTDDGMDMKDTEGRTLHAGIWSQFMLPSGGNAMSWWWYDLIHPNRLYYHFKALANYAKDLDRRGKDWSTQTGTVKDSDGNTIRVTALRSPDEILGWIYDPEILPSTKKPIDADGGIDVTIRVENLSPGPWIIETWDTWKGVLEQAVERRPENGALELTLRTNHPDAAFKLRRKTPAGTAERPSLALEEWDPAGGSQTDRNDLRIPHMENESATDGELKEWANAEWIDVGSETGRGFAFSVAHEDDVLLVAVRVSDDHVVRRHPAGGNLWRDDCVELWIDSLNDADYFNNMPHNPGCFQIDIAPAAGDFETAQTVYRHPRWNNSTHPDIQTASTLVGDGYIVEARIPLASLRGDRAADDPTHIGFNISICDSDPSGSDFSWSHLLWQGQQEYDARQWSEAVLEQPRTENREP